MNIKERKKSNFNFSFLFLFKLICVACILICFDRTSNSFAVKPVPVKKAELFVLTPKLIEEPLLNPGCGLTFPNYRKGQSIGLLPKNWVNIAYKRFLWKDLEPAEGVYQFQIIKNWIHTWKSKGFRVAFGVMSTSVRDRGKKPVQATPLWLYKSGVPGVPHLNGQQIDPVYWDYRYLKKLSALIRNMGKALNEGEGIEFIDMRGIGVFGEMHLGMGFKGMWTKKELKLYGFSEEAYYNAYKTMINAYKKAFPKTTLVLNIAPGRNQIRKLFPFIHGNWILPGREKIIKYCVKHGIGLRYDGLSLEHRISMKVISSYFQEYAFSNKLSFRGVKCIYEFARGEKNFFRLQKLFALALSDPISYLNLNFTGNLKKIDKRVKKLIYKAASKIGYRLCLLKLECPAKIDIPDSGKFYIPLRHVWENKGTAPCYESCKLVYCIEDNKGNLVSKFVQQPTVPFCKWLPRRKIQLVSQIPIPATLKNGIYSLKIGIYDYHHNVFIKLPLQNFDQKGYYILFIISVKKDSSKQVAAFIRKS